LVGKAANCPPTNCMLATAEETRLAITETKRFDFACTAIECISAPDSLGPAGRKTSRQFSRSHCAPTSGGGRQNYSPFQRIRFLGQFRAPTGYEDLTFALQTDEYGRPLMPLRASSIHDVEDGEAEPVKSASTTNDYGLVAAEDLKYAVLLSAQFANMLKLVFAIEIAAPALSGGSGVSLKRSASSRSMTPTVNAPRIATPGKILSFDGGRELSWKGPRGPAGSTILPPRLNARKNRDFYPKRNTEAARPQHIL